MSDPMDEDKIGQDRRDQMLKLVSKGFYKELVNYGVQREEIIRVASHLLDNLMTEKNSHGAGVEFYDNLFTIADVTDHWASKKQIAVRDICLKPLDRSMIDPVNEWLRSPGVRDLFVPPFPEEREELQSHLFESSKNSYLAIHRNNIVVGIVGAENMDLVSRKLEMKKLVGDPDTRGKGIGKQATFAFLYYAFRILKMHKVYVHSREINIRNINLNSKFGFVLEGIFLEELHVGDRYQDVVRMALFESLWTEIFSPNE